MFIHRRGLTPILMLAAVSAAGSDDAPCADDASVNQSRRVLIESSGDSVARACTLPNCATVLAVRHGDLIESAPSIPSQGPIRRSPPFGPYDPHVPPINQPSFMVQRQSDIWVIEVQRRDGTVEVIRQSYPVLFQVGDEVLVEGDHVRAPE